MNPWVRLIFFVTLLAVTLLVSCASWSLRRSFEDRNSSHKVVSDRDCNPRRALCGGT